MNLIKKNIRIPSLLLVFKGLTQVMVDPSSLNRGFIHDHARRRINLEEIGQM